MNTALYEQAEIVVKLLKEKKLTVATAESCTGGMVSSFITSVPGVSSVFELGITSYSCRIKHKILGVSEDTLDSFGAISEDTAREMADRVRYLAGSDIGIAVTGAAGPDGSEGHEPGFAFIALSNGVSILVKQLKIEPESRNFVREKIVSEVFQLIIKYAKEYRNES